MIGGNSDLQFPWKANQSFKGEKKLTGLTVSIEFRHQLLDAVEALAAIPFILFKGGNRFRIRNVTNLLTGIHSSGMCEASNSSINSPT